MTNVATAMPWLLPQIVADRPVLGAANFRTFTAGSRDVVCSVVVGIFTLHTAFSEAHCFFTYLDQVSEQGRRARVSFLELNLEDLALPIFLAGR